MFLSAKGIRQGTGNALAQKIGATHIHSQLGPPEKGLVKDKGVNLIPWVFGQKRRYLAPLGYPGLLDLTLKCHGHQTCLYEVIDEVTMIINCKEELPLF